MGHGLILCEYEPSTFRNKRVIKNQARFFMSPKFRNFGSKHQFFAEHQKSKILLRHIVSEQFGIFFRPCRGPLAARSRPPYGRDMTRRVVTPKSNTGRGAFARRIGRGGSVKNRCSRSICSRLRTLNEKSSGLINSNGSWLDPLWIWALDVSNRESYKKTGKLFHDSEISIFLVAKIFFLLNLKNRKFCLDISFPST